MNPCPIIKMACLKCGKCCKEFSFKSNQLSREDIEKMIPGIFEQHPIKVDNIVSCFLEIKFYGMCNNYDPKSGLCKDYDNRPQLCRNYLCEKVRDVGQGKK